MISGTGLWCTGSRRSKTGYMGEMRRSGGRVPPIEDERPEFIDEGLGHLRPGMPLLEEPELFLGTSRQADLHLRTGCQRRRIVGCGGGRAGCLGGVSGRAKRREAEGLVDSRREVDQASPVRPQIEEG